MPHSELPCSTVVPQHLKLSYLYHIIYSFDLLFFLCLSQIECPQKDRIFFFYFLYNVPQKLWMVLWTEVGGNPLQWSCLENPRDGGAWWAVVYGVSQSRTRLKRLSSSSSRVYMSVPVSQSSLPNLSFGNCKFVFCSYDYFCFENRFICTIFF